MTVTIVGFTRVVSQFPFGMTATMVPIPAGTTAGDRMFLVANGNYLVNLTEDGEIDPPVTWSQVHAPVIATGTGQARSLTVWEKVAGASESSVPVFFGLAFKHPSRGIDFHLVTVRDALSAAQNPQSDYWNYNPPAPSASTIAAPDPAPPGPAELFAFSFGNQPTGGVVAGWTRVYVSYPSTFQSGSATLFVRAVTGGATTMPVNPLGNGHGWLSFYLGDTPGGIGWVSTGSSGAHLSARGLGWY